MSKQLVGAATSPDPCGWRAGAGRVLANALLVLLAYEVVSMAAAAAQVILTGWTPPATPVEGVPLLVVVAVFLLVRRIYVLPGLLLVLVGLEYVARRAPHARVLTFIVALSPMAHVGAAVQVTGQLPFGAGSPPRRDRRPFRGPRASAGPLPGALDRRSWGSPTPCRNWGRSSLTRIGQVIGSRITTWVSLERRAANESRPLS